MRAYQRTTHYFRALNIRQPPPHLLAWIVVQRAINKAVDGTDVAPLRLAIEEVHAMLAEQDGPERPLGTANASARDSVRWRVEALLADGTRRLSFVPERGIASEIAARRMLLRRVPEEAPGLMVPQTLDLLPLRRFGNAIASKLRYLRSEVRWRRDHA